MGFKGSKVQILSSRPDFFVLKKIDYPALRSKCPSIMGTMKLRAFF